MRTANIIATPPGVEVLTLDRYVMAGEKEKVGRRERQIMMNRNIGLFSHSKIDKARQKIR